MLLQFICIYLHLKYERGQENLGGNVEHILHGKKRLVGDCLVRRPPRISVQETDLHGEKLPK